MPSRSTSTNERSYRHRLLLGVEHKITQFQHYWQAIDGYAADDPPGACLIQTIVAEDYCFPSFLHQYPDSIPDTPEVAIPYSLTSPCLKPDKMVNTRKVNIASYQQRIEACKNACQIVPDCVIAVLDKSMKNLDNISKVLAGAAKENIIKDFFHNAILRDIDDMQLQCNTGVMPLLRSVWYGTTSPSEASPNPPEVFQETVNSFVPTGDLQKSSTTCQQKVNDFFALVNKFLPTEDTNNRRAVIQETLSSCLMMRHHLSNFKGQFKLHAKSEYQSAFLKDDACYLEYLQVRKELVTSFQSLKKGSLQEEAAALLKEGTTNNQGVPPAPAPSTAINNSNGGSAAASDSITNHGSDGAAGAKRSAAALENPALPAAKYKRGPHSQTYEELPDDSLYYACPFCNHVKRITNEKRKGKNIGKDAKLITRLTFYPPDDKGRRRADMDAGLKPYKGSGRFDKCDYGMLPKMRSHVQSCYRKKNGLSADADVPEDDLPALYKDKRYRPPLLKTMDHKKYVKQLELLVRDAWNNQRTFRWSREDVPMTDEQLKPGRPLKPKYGG